MGAATTLPLTVPAPTAPDDTAAWYAADIHAQREVFPGVVVTVRGTDGPFRYQVREPPRTAAEVQVCDRLQSAYIEAAEPTHRPRTRAGLRERLTEGSPTDRPSTTPETYTKARRLWYHTIRNTVGFGALTGLSLDPQVTVADVTGDRIVVHTERFSPVETPVEGSHPDSDRFLTERLHEYTVSFGSFDIPVLLCRDHRIGADHFATRYVVREPPLTDGDRRLRDACEDWLWETTVDRSIDDPVTFISDRVNQFLERHPRPPDQGLLDRIRRFFDDTTVDHDRRRRSLTYYVLRDFVGEGVLTVPIRDPNLEDVEANRVDERIKVVPRPDFEPCGRIPSNLVFEEESTFVNVATRIAAADSVELNARRPTARVNLDPIGADTAATIRCAVALPSVTDGGPYIAIRKQATETLTPVDLIAADALSPELVALLWQLYQHHGVVLFAGPTGVGKTTVLNAHLPFIDFDDRPVAIDEGAREVSLPHETGLALSSRRVGGADPPVSMAQLIVECAYLNPDVEIVGEVTSPESFESFSAALSTGHGLIGTIHAADVETLVDRMVAHEVPLSQLREIDLVVFLNQRANDRYVSHAVEFLPQSAFEAVGGTGESVPGHDSLYWNEVARRDRHGRFTFAYSHPRLDESDETTKRSTWAADRLEQSAFEAPERHANESVVDASTPTCQTRLFHRLAALSDRPVQVIEAEFHRKLRYVTYLMQNDIDEFDTMFEFLADLQTDEAAVVERIRRDR